MSNIETGCFHCGEPIPAQCTLAVKFQGREHPVCCSGCQAVFQLIQNAGLDRYYQFRQEPGSKANANLARQELAWQAVDKRQTMWGVRGADGHYELLLQVEGLRCAACAWLIRSRLESSPGIHSVQVDTATGFTRITWNPDLIRLSAIAMALFELGYVPHLPIASIEEQGRRQERRNSLKRLGLAGLGMMQVMMYSVGLYAGDAFGMEPSARSFLSWISLLVTLPVLFYSGRVFFESAWKGLAAGRPGMDFPVALGIGLAFIASCYNFFRGEGTVWFDSVVMFIFFLTLGRHLELVLRHRSVAAGTALARLLPEWAQKITTGGCETIPSEDLSAGDQVRVAPGEAFPADGRICAGVTEVDEALLTGESQPAPRAVGDAVIAGTVNLRQAVDVRVSAAGADSTLSALGRMVLAAQTRQAGAEAGMPAWLVPVFVVAVVFLAIGTWIYWQGAEPGIAFGAALAVLVASCPCALSLALPAVNSAASHRLLREGILLTRSGALYDLLKVDTVIFDKTGTLTRGHPELQRIQLNPARPDCQENIALNVASALEDFSAHPVARAFRHSDKPFTASSVITHPAGALEGIILGNTWRIGSAAFIQDANAASDDSGDIWLADEKGWYARFTLADSLRTACRTTIDALTTRKLDLRVLSGDAEQAVARVAQAAGIPAWQSNTRPGGKLEVIHGLQAQGRTVLMIGDGANDAPVLAAADVSMTVQGATELANSTADFILTTESLRPVLRVLDLSHMAARLVRQNLVWALIYNAAILPLAMSGSLQPWMAALGMSASSLLVVLNAARIARPDASAKTFTAGAHLQPQLS